MKSMRLKILQDLLVKGVGVANLVRTLMTVDVQETLQLMEWLKTVNVTAKEMLTMDVDVIMHSQMNVILVVEVQVVMDVQIL